MSRHAHTGVDPIGQLCLDPFPGALALVWWSVLVRTADYDLAIPCCRPPCSVGMACLCMDGDASWGAATGHRPRDGGGQECGGWDRTGDAGRDGQPAATATARGIV